MHPKISKIIRIAIAVILIQTLRFKFTDHPDSAYIFETLGLEPYGRITVGILELIAGILILIPRTIWIGALMTVVILSGAVFHHLTDLGIEINGDGGKLFYMAIVTLILSLFILWDEREQIPVIGQKLKSA